MRGRITIFVVVLFVFSSWAYADWPDWRGPTADGRSDATGLPLTWSETENVVWKIPIHGLGHSTPVVWGDQIWLTTADEDGRTMYTVCVDLNTGEITHDIKVFEPEEPQRMRNDLNSYATPSAVVEEGCVYVHYGTHGTACLDSKTGDVLWRRTDLNCDHMQGPASSPVLFGDLLIVHLEGTDVQFIAALDKKTGDTVWRTDRPEEVYGDISRVERKSFHTPVILEIDGKAQLVSNGAQAVMGYDPHTGKEIWRVVYGDDNSISRIVADEDLMYVNCGGMDFRLWAVRKGGTGDVTDSHVVWKVDEDVPFRSSPVLVDGLLYMVNDGGILTCLEATTGKAVWSERLREKHSASPLYADDRIYLLSEKGKIRVIKPGRTFEVLAVNELDDSFFASPAVVGKSLLLRTKTNLYRIENR